MMRVLLLEKNNIKQCRIYITFENRSIAWCISIKQKYIGTNTNYFDINFIDIQLSVSVLLLLLDWYTQ